VGGYQPDSTFDSAYAILAYTLPLEKWLGGKTITPYVVWEWSVEDNTTKELCEMMAITPGINFKPSPYVTLKAEVKRMFSLHSTWLDAWKVDAQMAVSF